MLFNFLQAWGYLGVFLGSLIEGESVVLMVSSMAYLGKFSLHKVMFWAFLGTLIADQLSFYVGRLLGDRLFLKSKTLGEKSKKISRLLEKYDVPFIFGFRFIYGIRILSPFFIGISKISILKFSVLNFFSAVIWSILSCTLGYYVGALSGKLGLSQQSFVIACNLFVIIMIIIVFHVISKYLDKKM